MNNIDLVVGNLDTRSKTHKIEHKPNALIVFIVSNPCNEPGKSDQLRFLLIDLLRP